MRFALAFPGPALRVAGVATVAIGLEWARVLALRSPLLPALTLLAGGLALCLLGIGRRPADLGLGTARLAERLVGGLALAGVLLLPAAVRWGVGPVIGPELGVAAVAVSVGEEVAYRGVLFSELQQGFGSAAAVAGSTAAWTLAHALSHPPAFLPAVAAAGLLLAAWRWAANDLVGPLVGHVLADLAL
ncbi:MAG TPA: CPBP family glutamic-type intramembrane protease [Candidatus Dormibacteraeota bacterium]|nr:CPBP family glutamic-type intramembrane protease [Candidatus Dormibacteraeota bacterium]